MYLGKRQIICQWSFHRYVTICPRMCKLNVAGMQEMPWTPTKILFVALSASVESIRHQWMPDVRKMNANLVHPARLQHTFYE